MKHTPWISGILVLACAAVASADLLAYQGPVFSVYVTDPVAVGTGAEGLISFTLRIENTSGNSLHNPSAFMAIPCEFGDLGFSGQFHQHNWPEMDVTTPDASNPTFSDTTDTHFLFDASEVVSGAPSLEDFGLVASSEPADVGSHSYGSFLAGGSGLIGGNSNDYWEFVQFVVKDPGEALGIAPLGTEGAIVDAFFQMAGKSGETYLTSFAIVPESIASSIPEPATMSLLTLGAVALLRRRK
jgi:hypothetical protein